MSAAARPAGCNACLTARLRCLREHGDREFSCTSLLLCRKSVQRMERSAGEKGATHHCNRKYSSGVCIFLNLEMVLVHRHQICVGCHSYNLLFLLLMPATTFLLTLQDVAIKVSNQAHGPVHLAVFEKVQPVKHPCTLLFAFGVQKTSCGGSKTGAV